MEEVKDSTEIISTLNETEKKPIVRATHGSPDHPLKIGDLEISCYVLEDGTRVLHHRGMVKALGMARGGSSVGGGDRLAHFINGKGLAEFVGSELYEAINVPIKFRTPKGATAYGYEATILADICESVLKARTAGKLQKQQLHIAERCEILVRGFARVGIIALVDEVTGYQEVRARQALEEILQNFISKELAKWARMFPPDYYEQLFRLKNLQYHEFSTKRPIIIAKLTNDLVYERLAPGVLDEMKRKTPKDEKGRRKNKYFQWLTNDLGVPALREHLAAVIALMKASPDWNTFTRLINRALPSWKGNQLEMQGFEDV